MASKMTSLNAASAATINSEFEQYLKNHAAAKGDPYTHTRIGDTKLNIYAGSYNIPPEAEADFVKKYFKYVFVNGKQEYLTEKQFIEQGPIMIDIDMRYDTSISAKQHSEDHIIDAVMLYADKISELVTVPPGTTIEVFVMEKNDVNKLEEATKDGIHIIFGVQMHKAVQVMLRDKVMPELKDIWSDLPITNTWDQVLDEGVTKGYVNWQMYGSRKPGHQAYMIKYHLTLTYVDRDNGWTPEKQNIDIFSTEKNIAKLSAHYTKYPAFPLKEHVTEAFELAKSTLGRSTTNNKKTAPKKYKLKIAGKDGVSGAINYADIESEDTLDVLLEQLFEEMGPCNYRLKETHQYTMCLPVAYYGPGSYNKWIRVGWALANTSPNLFLSWVKFSCQANGRDTLKGANGKFDWTCVKELYEIWNTFDSNNTDGLTHRSIMFWCKNDARDKYNKIRMETIDYFIEQTVQTATDFDLASVLYNMYKDDFVCVSIKNNIWYEYINHRWYEIDSGSTLRLLISKDMHFIYNQKVQENMLKIQTFDQDDSKGDELRKFNNKLAEICALLKRTNSKNNIMREARELFYDKSFIEKLDQNPYLLCFNNYVVDFKNKCHRKGQPDDYISKCTNIDYIPLSIVKAKHSRSVAEIEQFFEQLFPDADLRKYMWEHLASCLIGTIVNQTFTIYKGSGRNGKSKLVELMGKGMGSYKGTVPITLITQKRNTIGSTSSEVAQLMGVRYAVMQEMSKGDKMNEGIMKEITGGDPIQARALFKDTVTFIPQFKLVVATNVDFEETSNDDGTWRRLRYVDFKSKFLEKPYEDEIKFPRSECPYQFPLDKNLDSKFEAWAPVLMSLLVEKSYDLQGIVNDCKTVLANSDQHRDKLDYFTEFAKDKIKKQDGERIKKTELLETFKIWFTVTHGKGMPKGKEIMEFMDKRYGVYKQGWHNAAIIYDDDETTF
jgi:P4 family phage/plasmid primase-like protien